MNHEFNGKYHSGPHTKWNITEPQIPQVTVFSEYRGKSDHIPIKILKYQLKGRKSNERYYFAVSTTGHGRPSEEKGDHDTSKLSFSQAIQLVSLFWVHYILTLFIKPCEIRDVIPSSTLYSIAKIKYVSLLLNNNILI